MNQSIVEDIVSHFGEKVFEFEEPFGLLTFTTHAENLIEIVSYLKDHPTFKFTFLTDVTGIHLPDNTGKEFCSVCHLHSWENRVRLRIKVFVPTSAPIVPSLTPLFECANWLEREAFDFFGILYSGHPNLKRILNMDEMDYFPMRKEYPMEDATRNDKIDAMFGR
ncbi:NADH-quinone oxidoreductase subunit C [Lacihabitans sp. LS3-19]|uniref:NADH-quinone oxidoreductase subunit C n=1 Tax=Lacihabitans sp. LS3-19 TaxID=2487335 RepID=UPI0020CCB9F9|nr:NADH-quinone oxidoreductase subunit C [Lacihabitans sp. LS3-19]MCP9767368.1 NADH-quinone oxidoreductase subunit C [Lacihabitans sp. LS3-19]